ALRARAPPPGPGPASAAHRAPRVARSALDDRRRAGRSLGPDPGAAPRRRRARRCDQRGRHRLRVSGLPRQYRLEAAALADPAAHADAAALGLDDLAGQGEADAGAGRPAVAGVELLELEEQPLHLIGRDADAGVLDLEAERIRRLGAGAHDDAAALGRELERV